MVRRGLLEAGQPSLQKPFTPEMLALRVRVRETVETAKGRYDFGWVKTSNPEMRELLRDEAALTNTRRAELDAASSFPYTPTFRSEADETVKVPAWLNDTTLYHNRGDTTFEGENSSYGDFFGLDDLFTEHPKVVNGMVDIYEKWIGDFGVDGSLTGVRAARWRRRYNPR